MAAGGDGGFSGFSQAPMGFNKKEVNDYIGQLMLRMKENDAERKANDEKTAKALKAAKEADDKIKAIKNESSKKISELELQLKTERRNEENLLIQIDDLKRKLKQKPAAGATDSGKPSAASEKQSAEIINKANATAKEIVDKANAVARDTVEKAKAAAQQIMAGAGSAGGGGMSVTGLEEFLTVLMDFTNELKDNLGKITDGINNVNDKASEIKIIESEGGAPVSMPDFSDISAPQAEAPAAEAPAAAPSRSSKSSKSSSKASKSSTEDLFAALDDDFGSDDSKSNDDDMGMSGDLFGGSASGSSSVVLDEFDLSESAPVMDFSSMGGDVQPIDNKNRGHADLSDDFEKQILAQAASSSSLKGSMSDEMYAAVRSQEEHFAVKPSNNELTDFDMVGGDEPEDPMAAMLRQAELAFGGATGNSVQDEEPEEGSSSSSSSSGSDNPWADLQNELMAMEKSGNFGAEEEAPAKNDNRAVPNADDSSIWGFGDDSGSSSSDDDMGMSGDLFGSF